MMAATSGRDVGDDDESGVAVTAHSTSTNRTVFVEPGNTEAWIATDVTADLER